MAKTVDASIEMNRRLQLLIVMSLYGMRVCGIGRRAGFKIPFHWSVGSIPTTRTIDSESLIFPSEYRI